MFEELDTPQMKAFLGSRVAGIQRYIGEYLYSFIREHGIRTVVETGIGYGFSSYYFLSALPQDGKLISIENSVLWGDLIVPPNWRDRWRIIEEKSTICLKDICEEIRPDLFWHDSNHSEQCQLQEYRTAYPNVRFIGSHDIHRKKTQAWDKFKREVGLKVVIEDENFGLARGLCEI